jgi:hypothetical protein
MKNTGFLRDHENLRKYGRRPLVNFENPIDRRQDCEARVEGLEFADGHYGGCSDGERTC